VERHLKQKVVNIKLAINTIHNIEIKKKGIIMKSYEAFLEESKSNMKIKIFNSDNNVVGNRLVSDIHQRADVITGDISSFATVKINKKVYTVKLNSSGTVGKVILKRALEINYKIV
jgi:hypothetical protein